MYNKEQLFDVWRQAIIKSLMEPAQRLLDGQPKKRATGDGTTTLIKIIPLVIISLSLASVTNMASRAWEHHASYSSYAIGLGLAVMVPVIVFTALRLDSALAKLFAWLCASVFAFASGSIQFQIYNAGQPITFDTLFSFGVNLEALAFGFGVPFAECVLAGLEGLLVWQVEKKERQETAQAQAQDAQVKAQQEAQAKAEQEARERKERERQEWQEAQERKRQEWQAEQDRVAAEHAQRLALERQKAEVKLQKGVQLSTVHDATKTSATPTQSRDVAQYDEEKLRQLVQLLETNGSVSNDVLAEHFAVHKTTIGRWVDALAAAKVLDKVGRKKVLNGHHKQFLAGASLAELG